MAGEVEKVEQDIQQTKQDISKQEQTIAEAKKSFSTPVKVPVLTQAQTRNLTRLQKAQIKGQIASAEQQRKAGLQQVLSQESLFKTQATAARTQIAQTEKQIAGYKQEVANITKQNSEWDTARKIVFKGGRTVSSELRYGTPGIKSKIRKLLESGVQSAEQMKQGIYPKQFVAKLEPLTEIKEFRQQMKTSGIPAIDLGQVTESVKVPITTFKTTAIPARRIEEGITPPSTEPKFSFTEILPGGKIETRDIQYDRGFIPVTPTLKKPEFVFRGVALGDLKREGEFSLTRAVELPSGDAQDYTFKFKDGKLIDSRPLEGVMEKRFIRIQPYVKLVDTSVSQVKVPLKKSNIFEVKAKELFDEKPFFQRLWEGTPLGAGLSLIGKGQKFVSESLIKEGVDLTKVKGPIGAIAKFETIRERDYPEQSTIGFLFREGRKTPFVKVIRESIWGIPITPPSGLMKPALTFLPLIGSTGIKGEPSKSFIPGVKLKDVIEVSGKGLKFAWEGVKKVPGGVGLGLSSVAAVPLIPPIPVSTLMPGTGTAYTEPITVGDVGRWVVDNVPVYSKAISKEYETEKSIAGLENSRESIIKSLEKVGEDYAKVKDTPHIIERNKRIADINKYRGTNPEKAEDLYQDLITYNVKNAKAITTEEAKVSKQKELFVSAELYKGILTGDLYKGKFTTTPSGNQQLTFSKDIREEELRKGFREKKLKESIPSHIFRKWKGMSVEAFTDIAELGPFAFAPGGIRKTPASQTQYSPGSKLIGKGLAGAQDLAFYFTPVVAPLKIYGGTIEKTVTGDIKQFAKEEPAEVGLAALYGLGTIATKVPKLIRKAELSALEKARPEIGRGFESVKGGKTTAWLVTDKKVAVNIFGKKITVAQSRAKTVLDIRKIIEGKKIGYQIEAGTGVLKIKTRGIFGIRTEKVPLFSFSGSATPGVRARLVQSGLKFQAPEHVTRITGKTQLVTTQEPFRTITSDFGGIAKKQGEFTKFVAGQIKGKTRVRTKPFIGEPVVHRVGPKGLSTLPSSSLPEVIVTPTTMGKIKTLSLEDKIKIMEKLKKLSKGSYKATIKSGKLSLIPVSKKAQIMIDIPKSDSVSKPLLESVKASQESSKLKHVFAETAIELSPAIESGRITGAFVSQEAFKLLKVKPESFNVLGLGVGLTPQQGTSTTKKTMLRTLQKPTEIQSVAPAFLEAEAVAQAEESATTTTSSVRSALKPKPPITTTPQTPETPPIIPIPIPTPSPSVPPRKFPKLILPKFLGEKKKVKKKRKAMVIKESGYQVLVKPLKQKGFVKANLNPLTKTKARDLGSYITDTTLGATYKIKRTTKNALKPRLKVPKSYASKTQDKFRTYKMVKGKRKKIVDTWIEKKNKRLDTPGEIGKVQVLARISKLHMKAKRKSIPKPIAPFSISATKTKSTIKFI